MHSPQFYPPTGVFGSVFLGISVTKVSPQPYVVCFANVWGRFVESISASRGMDFLPGPFGGMNFGPIRGIDFRAIVCSGIDFDPVLEI